MTHHIDLNTITLAAGGHDARADGTCLTEAVAWWAGEDHTEQPDCMCPTLATFGRAWNDGMRSDAERAQLVPYIPVLAGTAGSDQDAARRGWMALDWSVRVSTSAWLDLAGLSVHAARLREAPEVVDAATCPTDDLAAAGEAGWAAARAAARAVDWDVLEPTVIEMQQSAHVLLRRMVAAGPHDRDALAALPEVAA